MKITAFVLLLLYFGWKFSCSVYLLFKKGKFDDKHLKVMETLNLTFKMIVYGMFEHSFMLFLVLILYLL